MTQSNQDPESYDVLIVGAGQAGLTLSYFLQQAGLSHILLEKRTALHSWKHERWDNFTLVTPNWQCDLPGLAYDGDDPDGFMTGTETVAWLQRFADKVAAPVKEGVEVRQVVQKANGRYLVLASDGTYGAGQVVVCSGGYHEPVIPRMAERLPGQIRQLHSAEYKNAAQLPGGAVLVVGSGQSGAQIAEDLHLAGRKVHLATGDAPRVARFYRGKDVVRWLDDMGYYGMSVDAHPLGRNVRSNTNHYVTGRDGGRDIDLRQFATEGMSLYGSMVDYDHGELVFTPNLAANLEKADNTYNNINARIDAWIASQGITTEDPASQYQPVWTVQEEPTRLDLADAGVSSIIWCIGYRPDFKWLDAPVFNGQGHPRHERGVTAQPGLYFLGLPWLHTWGSGRFSGVREDAAYLAERIVAEARHSDSTEDSARSIA